MGLLLSKQEIEIAIPDRPSGIDRTVEKIAAAVIVVGLAPAGIAKPAAPPESALKPRGLDFYQGARRMLFAEMLFSHQPASLRC